MCDGFKLSAMIGRFSHFPLVENAAHIGQWLDTVPAVLGFFPSMSWCWSPLLTILFCPVYRSEHNFVVIQMLS